MSVLEIKGGLHELISKVNDKQLLKQLHELFIEIITLNASKTDFWEDLTTAQQKELEKAVEESYDEKNLIPHSTMLKKYKKWLN